MAVRDFFQNYLYGNPSKRDFTEADLPENRIQLFKQVLSTRKGKMFGINLLYILVWLPAIAWTIINVVQINRALYLPPAEFWSALPQILFSWLLLLFPLVAITGPFNAGFSYVFHRWAQDVHSFILSDFRAALKENWKQALLFSTLDGLVPLLAYTICYFYLGLAGQSLLSIVPLMLTLLAVLIWSLAAPLVPLLIVSYEQSFGKLLRNAVFMTLINLPRSIAIRLGTLILPIFLTFGLFFFPDSINWMISVTLLLYVVFMLSFNKLIWASYSNMLGEKYLNARIEGARTNIGLRPKQGD